MHFNFCSICKKKTYQFYELKSFPINIYEQNKKKAKKKTLKLFFCKYCNHIFIPKIKFENTIYKSYKKKAFFPNNNKSIEVNCKEKILEISKEKLSTINGNNTDHFTIFNKNYLNISKKYNKIIVNDCISNIYNIGLFFKKVSRSLEDKGEIQILHHYGPSLIKNLNVDRIYFEHINNFSFKSLEYLANKHDLKIIKFKLLEKKKFF